MNYQALSDDLLSGNYNRFDAAQTLQAQYWLNHAYSLVWSAASWPWKVVPNQTIAVAAGTRQTSLWPSGAMTNLRLAFIQDDLGAPVSYLAPQQFFRTYGAQNAALSGDATSKPTEWTMVGDQILWSSVPDASYSFNAVLEHNVFVRTSAGAYKNGVFDLGAPTDVPAWNEPFHYVLVLGASGTGLAMENDPTAGTLLGLFAQGIEAMVSHFLPGALTTSQLARDTAV